MNNNSFNINHYDDEPIINELGFREYDARWIYPKQINLSGIKKIGYGLGQLMIEENIKKEILDTFEIAWRDNVKARVFSDRFDNAYKKLEKPAIRSQFVTYDYYKSKLNLKQ